MSYELVNRPRSLLSLWPSGRASECAIQRSEVSHGDSSWRLRIFSLSHACETTKNIFLYLKYMLGTDHAEYKDTQENINFQKLFQNVAVIEMQPLSLFYLK